MCSYSRWVSLCCTFRIRSLATGTPTLERTMDAVLAPLYYRAVFTNLPLTPEWTRSLVTHLLPD